MRSDSSFILPPSSLSLTDLDRAAAFQLADCTFRPGSFEKRFARDIASLVALGRAVLTPRQLYYLWKLCYRFRRQLTGPVRAEAERRHAPPPAVAKGFKQPTLFELLEV